MRIRSSKWKRSKIVTASALLVGVIMAMIAVKVDEVTRQPIITLIFFLIAVALVSLFDKATIKAIEMDLKEE